MSTWTRPASVPIPTIWSTFEGRIVIDGKKRAYWIQDISDEYRDEVVKYMTEEFVANEPLRKYSRDFEVPELMQLYKDVLVDTMKHNLGLLCLTKDKNGKPTIAAMNCTALFTEEDMKRPALEVPYNTAAHTVKYVKSQVDVFKKFNITGYLDGKGLYVLPEYRGDGLGVELIKAREPLCRACGIKVSLTLFTSLAAQKLGERAGFKDLYCVDYDELERINPKFCYTGIQENTKTLRWMYKLYE